MSEALTITRIPLDRTQVAIILALLEKSAISGRDELIKVFTRAARRMDPTIPHGKEPNA